MEEQGEGLELTTVNPGLVLGPMCGPAMSTSNEAVAKLLNREFPACPDFTYSMVDVRDVAAVLAREYGPKGYRVPTGNLPNALVRLVAMIDKTAALALNDLANPQHVDNTAVSALLGRPLRSLDEMTVAMAGSLIAYGLVKPSRRERRSKRA